MRISDWSSDVCSSDLRWGGSRLRKSRRGNSGQHGAGQQGNSQTLVEVAVICRCHAFIHLRIQKAGLLPRSEEHTSELQSLMRISYAVFCLKKKKQYILRVYTHH